MNPLKTRRKKVRMEAKKDLLNVRCREVKKKIKGKGQRREGQKEIKKKGMKEKREGEREELMLVRRN